MKSGLGIRILSIGFVLAFFAYLFGPLIIMSLTAFNSSQFPRVTPWECFSAEWFNVLIQDTRLMEGLRKFAEKYEGTYAGEQARKKLRR